MIKQSCFILLLIFLLNINYAFAEEPDKVEKLLIENKNLIYSSAELFNIQPRIIAAIIYTERTLNVNWMENELDQLLAKTGYSSSLGIGQIKIHTAQWIEKKLHDSLSNYYLGDIAKINISKSKNREEVIERLKDPQWNLKYIAAYIAMFCRRWSKECFNISDKPDIIGTLYSLGPYRVQDGTERAPHGSPKSNYFGEETAKFYFSKQLSKNF